MPKYTIPFSTTLTLSGTLTIEADTLDPSTAHDLAVDDISAALDDLDINDFLNNCDSTDPDATIDFQTSISQSGPTTIRLADIKQAS